MKALQTSVTATVIASAWVFTLAIPHPAFSETPAHHNASALLDEAKLIDYEQRVTAKKTEMDRLNEDLKKGADEIEALDKRIQKAGTAVDDAAKQLEHYPEVQKRASLEMDLLNLRINAERLKGDGLRMLQNANKKSQEAVAKRNEETGARTALVAAETRQLAAKAPVPPLESGPSKHPAKNDLTLTDWRKKLAKAEHATAVAQSQAREAMSAATTRLQEAENAAVKAEKKRAEVALDKNPGFDGGNDPLTPAAKR